MHLCFKIFRVMANSTDLDQSGSVLFAYYAILSKTLVYEILGYLP